MPDYAPWSTFAAEAPELEQAARTHLESDKHKTIATLRIDGSPRISGTEIDVIDGDLWFGAMLGSRRAEDLLRDPRCAVHSPSRGGDAWQGDTKFTGVAELIDDDAMKRDLVAKQGLPESEEEPMEYDLFRVRLRELSVVRMDGDALKVEIWKPGEPVRSLRRG